MHPEINEKTPIARGSSLKIGSVLLSQGVINLTV